MKLDSKLGTARVNPIVLIPSLTNFIILIAMTSNKTDCNSVYVTFLKSSNNAPKFSLSFNLRLYFLCNILRKGSKVLLPNSTTIKSLLFLNLYVR